MTSTCNCPDTYRAIHPEQHIDTCPMVSKDQAVGVLLPVQRECVEYTKDKEP